jgi:hypothetical protein
VSKQEVIHIIEQLSEEQLEKVFDYISVTFFQKNTDVTPLDEEQRELLELVNDTIDTGRGDFAEKHDQYLYGTS